jgi:hypothetical protein
LHPIPNLTTCQSSPDARKPTSVAIPLNLLRKRRIKVKDVNVGQGKLKMDKMVRRRE